MAYSVTIECPGAPRAEVLEAAIAALVAANVQWYLDEWAAGRDPDCCASCAGVRYRPTPPSSSYRLRSIPQAMRDGYASCETAAAWAVAHGIGKEVQRGVPYASAASRHRVQLAEGWHPEQKPGEPYWHAFVLGPKGSKDPTKKMVRA